MFSEIDFIHTVLILHQIGIMFCAVDTQNESFYGAWLGHILTFLCSDNQIFVDCVTSVIRDGVSMDQIHPISICTFYFSLQIKTLLAFSFNLLAQRFDLKTILLCPGQSFLELETRPG